MRLLETRVMSAFVPDSRRSTGALHFATWRPLLGLAIWVSILCHMWMQENNLAAVNALAALILVLASPSLREQTSAVSVAGDKSSGTATSFDFYEQTLIKVAITIVNWGMVSAVKNL